MKKLLLSLITISSALFVSAAAYAQDICADRPGKTTSPCTIGAGHVQVETDLVNRTTADGARTLSLFNPTVKLGVSNGLDLEVNLPLHQVIHDGKYRVTGLGDVTVATKLKITNGVSLVPFVKAPISHGLLSNGKFEGGAILPVSLPVGPFTLTYSPELDVLHDSTGHGYHVATQQAASVSYPLLKNVTVAGELWANIDDHEKFRRTSADVSLAYVVLPNVQLDAGANFGLNRQSTQLYAGIATRF